MPITVIEGEQRGDEGKGRFVDMLIPDYDIGARFNGGNNAGHTVVSPEGEVYKLHGLPTSVIYSDKKSVIGNGTVINPVGLTNEMDTLAAQDVKVDPCNLLISSAAHLILPHYIVADKIRESGAGGQGSTQTGIAQAYAAKHERVGLRAETIKNNPDLLLKTVLKGLEDQVKVREQLEKKLGRELEINEIDPVAMTDEFEERALRLGGFVTDTVLFLNRELKAGKSILAEGAQAFLLDIDQGMYPYVTSSSTTSGGVSNGLGVPCSAIDRVIGVTKVVQSHVGGGPFVTEIKDPVALAKIHGDMSKVDAEQGTTTGRKRRLGYLDIPALRRSQMINGTDRSAITKLDWYTADRYGEEIPICTEYERKGKRLEIAPDAAYKLEQCRPVYERHPSIKEGIQHIKNFDELPIEGQNIIQRIEELTGVPISMIGVGPGRDQVIVR